jgi:hypothetical protein
MNSWFDQLTTSERVRLARAHIGVPNVGSAVLSIRQVRMTGRESTFTIPAEAEPASVVLDPRIWLLADFGAFQKASQSFGFKTCGVRLRPDLRSA